MYGEGWLDLMVLSDARFWLGQVRLSLSASSRLFSDTVLYETTEV